MSEEIAEKDRIVSERIPSILSDTSFDFSVRGLQKIHFLLLKDLLGKAGEFRNKLNPRKKEPILQGSSVKYADSYEIPILLEKIIFEEQNFVPHLSSEPLIIENLKKSFLSENY